MKALAIIRDEHRSIAAVLQGLRYVVEEAGANRMPPDFALMEAMVAYIEAFPERLHHPKEDDYLFPAVLTRRPELKSVVEGLEREHAAGRDAIAGLKRALDDYRTGGDAGHPAFAATLARYVDFHWKHMTTEEEQVLPVAEESLDASDWAPIDATFASNDDPLVGVDASREMRELFRRIVHLAPPPIGVGPDRGKR